MAKKKTNKKKYKSLKKDLRKAKVKVKTTAGHYKKLAERTSTKIKKAEKRAARFKKKAFTPKDSRKQISRRASGALGALKAMGVIQETTKGGRGRPSGTYKHGMPIHEYKKLRSRQKASYQEYQEDRMRQLQSKGLTAEQIREIQFRKAITKVEGRNDLSTYNKNQIVQRISRKQMQVQNLKSMIDDELEFQRYAAKNTVSPSAQAILTKLRRVQNKGKADDTRQQRIQEERRIVEKGMNPMEAHENLNKVKLDFTGVNPEENILFAPNTFKEELQENILRPKRGNILDTSSHGNTLRF